MVVSNDLNLTLPAKALEKTTHFVSLPVLVICRGPYKNEQCNGPRPNSQI